MKKILLAASLFITATSFAGYYNFNSSSSIVQAEGRHIPASQVPAAVRSSFMSMFSNATRVRWELEKEHGQTVYQADFNLNGQRYRAVFLANGTFVKGGPH